MLRSSSEQEAGLATFEENDTTCCYVPQDKVWVHGPGNEPWKVYVVKADAHSLTKQADSACCTTDAADHPHPGRNVILAPSHAS